MSQEQVGFLSQGFPNLLCNIVLWPVCLDLDYPVLVKIYNLHEGTTYLSHSHIF